MYEELQRLKLLVRDQLGVKMLSMALALDSIGSVVFDVFPLDSYGFSTNLSLYAEERESIPINRPFLVIVHQPSSECHLFVPLESHHLGRTGIAILSATLQL
ncbi:MAG: hypothetical protein VKO39_08380 [Cyanobacteriota bacterium]|nr:hypothetical protein [Cyanobacteriota bacterium]